MSVTGGSIKLNGLNLKPMENKPSEVQLKGINWQTKAVVIPTSQYDSSKVNNVSYGDIPSSEEAFKFEDTPVENTKPNKAVKAPRSEAEQYKAVGIGMAVGAVVLGIAGSFIAPGAGTAAGISTGTKIGALIGLAVGGTIGNAISK